MMEESTCPSDDVLAVFVERRADASGSIEGHLDACANCRALVANLAALGAEQRDKAKDLVDPAAATIRTLGVPPTLASDGDPASPARISRYVVERELGRGGMGVVLLARDPDLDRKVAVKVVRGHAGDETARARLLREARAMARLSHPNVVAIHDVGTLDNGDVFLAMELVEGPTLRAAVAARRGNVAEVIDLFVQAGRGLAAAHAVGLVHRDFKPENVLVGVDGRVRVTDFGLARGDAAALSPALTGHGVLVGTPAYMAPEQHAAMPATDRSDQYAFCIALFEALTGERPHPGTSFEEISAAKLSDHRRPWPSPAEVPNEIRAAIDRGLARDAAERHPSMGALVAVLERAPGGDAATDKTFALSATMTALTVAASDVGSDPSRTLLDDARELPHLTLDVGTDPGNASELFLIGLLGEGGMGRVYVARQRSLRRQVAVKTLKPNATADVARALLREARMTGMLEHPGVIPVHAIGLDDARSPVLVMKRIEGVSLKDRLAQEGPLGGSEDRLVAGVELLIQLCRTIEFAHSRGIIHRDIKPENIMLGGFGEVYLVDWGIAVLKTEVADGSIVGTPHYMAPEMVLGRGVDERTDVYLIGATFHEMLTGRPRHDDKTLMDVMRVAMLSAPYPYGVSVPEELARLCNRATARRPDDRFASAAALREALAGFLRHQTANALADAAVERVALLESLVASPEKQLPDLAHAHRLSAEARFGLTESLRQDPTGAAAQRGMRRLRAAAVDLELRQDHLETAEALLAEIASPDAELVRRVEACRERVGSRAREHARLAELDRDADPSVDAQKRTVRLAVMAGSTATAGVVVSAVGPRVTAMSILLVGIGFFVLLVGSALILRKKLVNAFNRRIAAFAVLAMGAMVCNRVVAVFAGRPPDETLRGDLFLLGVLLVAGSISILREIWLGLLVLGAAYAASSVWPDLAAPIFTVTTVVLVCVCAVVLARARRDGQ